MDVESQTTIDEAIGRAKAAVDSSAAAAIDRLQNVAAVSIDRFMTEIGPILHGLQVSLADTEGRAVADVHGLLDRLNGAKLVLVDGGLQLSIPERK